MNLTSKITDFLMGQKHFTYCNKECVEFECTDHLTFRAACTLLEFETAEGDERLLEVEYIRKKRYFISDLKISSLRDLNSIAGETLKELYEIGKAEYVCFVDLQYVACMTFRKEKGKTIACNNKAKDHVVERILETPSEFISYTIEYYRLNSDVLCE